MLATNMESTFVSSVPPVDLFGHSTVNPAHRATGVAVDRENREKDDWYPTPPEGTEALLRAESFDGPIWECACGDGAMSRVLEAAGYEVISTDLVDRGYGTPRVDFLMETRALAPNIVTNPPFKLSTEFIRHAVSLSNGKVAMLLRLACLEGATRGGIYDSTPLARVLVFRRRLSLQRGRMATDEDASGMVAMAWFVWHSGHSGPPTLGWL